ncbi:ORF6N domain-containing protein [Marinilabilia salmonicolor]|uniref:ORF6N domain-containing protein n=1 Tax=Marinilabilia salmonicolor TaxID=989 RepID=UPI00029AFD9D|nr:ORF6N domain-containing protein [Marinilabilia salmonicolor]
MELQSNIGKIILVQGKQAILDNDVAELYSAETKRINKTGKNNPYKFTERSILL